VTVIVARQTPIDIPELAYMVTIVVLISAAGHSVMA
jgi:hypothetical protein